MQDRIRDKKMARMHLCEPTPIKSILIHILCEWFRNHTDSHEKNLFLRTWPTVQIHWPLRVMLDAFIEPVSRVINLLSQRVFADCIHAEPRQAQLKEKK